MLRIIPLVLPVSALLLVLGLINPSSTHSLETHAYGESRNSSGSSYSASTDASLSFSIHTNEQTLGDDATVSEEVTAGVVSVINTGLKVTTKNIDKFYVSVQAAENATSELVGTTHPTEKIDGVGSNVKTIDFADNTWGYALSDASASDLTYSTLPAHSSVSPIQYTSATNLDDGEYNLALSFAAKINANKPADHYTTNVLVSVVADAKTTLNTFTYMQDPRLPEYCTSENAQSGKSKQLIDGRDNKSYWVTVLAGTCWMTQDLDFDLQNAVLTTENTGANLYKGSQTAWDVGNVESTSTDWTTSDYNTVNWYSRDDSHGTEHTSLGNLYSYQAATANTGSATTSDNAEVSGSICPAGWKLPLSGNSTATGSFKSLETSGGYDNFSNMTSNTLANGAPYYFQYGGYIYGSLNSVGSRGRYWSATSRSNSLVYYLYFLTSGGFDTTSYSERGNGFSVRCVVR